MLKKCDFAEVSVNIGQRGSGWWGYSGGKWGKTVVPGENRRRTVKAALGEYISFLLQTLLGPLTSTLPALPAQLYQGAVLNIASR